LMGHLIAREIFQINREVFQEFPHFFRSDL
jgi:hypothetical protein